jgi:flavin reductase (DIM6/NTAB) family NADH-FMN oxidoreductase RutF
MAVSKDEFRKTLGQFATGVTVVTVAGEDGQVYGMTANAFTSVSLVPPLVLICVDHSSRTHPLLSQQESFGVNVLREDQEAISSYYASSDRTHEIADGLGVEYCASDGGVPLLSPCLAQIACRKVATHEAGDHTIFIGVAEQTEVSEGKPLLFFDGKYGRLNGGAS